MYLLMTDFGRPEETLCGLQVCKIQLLQVTYEAVFGFVSMDSH